MFVPAVIVVVMDVISYIQPLYLILKLASRSCVILKASAYLLVWWNIHVDPFPIYANILQRTANILGVFNCPYIYM